MNEAAVGIDVSKLKLDVCVVDGMKFKYKVVKNTRSGHSELTAWLSQRHLSSDVPVVLEATGPYSEAAATALADAGWRVSVVNPARTGGATAGAPGYASAGMRQTGSIASGNGSGQTVQSHRNGP